ncbi:MAG: HNH endonuclease [Burkholderiales bacterium]
MATYDDAYLQETLRKAFEDPLLYKLPQGIIRYDYAHTHGWWVRVTRDGARFRKIFSDGQFESLDDGLRQAILHRHKILSSFPVTIKHIHARAIPPEPEKRIELKTDKGKNQPYVFWEAKWYDENHNVKKKCFSVQKYGHEEARALALAVAKSNHNKKPKLTAHPDVYQTSKFKELPRADVAVFATINSNPYSKGSGASTAEDIAATYPHSFEGEKKFVLHQSIERDRKLRDQKIGLFLEKHGKLFCELCGFRFVEAYPFLKRDVIEVHHIVPLSTLSKATLVTPNDLMLLCANCHLAVHQGDAEENLLTAMVCFEDKQEKNDR